MAKVLRWSGYVLGGLLLLVLIAAAYIWFASTQTLQARVPPVQERLAVPTPAQLADATRQMRILGCMSCHGEDLRGDMVFDDPKIATIPAPNLTLLAAKATDQQLAQAIRQGIGHDGRSLIVMPSAEYSHLTDEEVAVLIAGLRAMPPGGEQMPPVKIGPIGRLALLNGKLAMQPHTVEHYRLNTPAELGPQFARGRHIALTACSECHGPTFGGKEVEPGLVAPPLDIVGAYDLPAFARLMRTGVPADGRKLRLMDEVARGDFSYLDEKEIAALHAYLVERARRAP